MSVCLYEIVCCQQLKDYHAENNVRKICAIIYMT